MPQEYNLLKTCASWPSWKQLERKARIIHYISHKPWDAHDCPQTEQGYVKTYHYWHQANGTVPAKVIKKPVSPPEKFMAVTIGVGAEYERMAYRAAESVKRSTGITPLVLTDSILLAHPEISRFENPKDRGLFSQLYILDFMYDCYDTLLYFDADTLFMREWDVTPYSNTDKIVAVKDIDTPMLKSDSKHFGVDPKTYFNIGMMILTKKHKPIFDQVKENHWLLKGGPKPIMNEQTMINKAAQKMGVEMHWLDERYNFINYGTRPAPDDVVVAHACGGAGLVENKQHFENAVAKRRCSCKDAS